MSGGHTVICVGLLALAAAASPWAIDARAPDRMEIEGAGSVPRVAHALRSHLLDTVEVYAISLYADGAMDLAHLSSANTAKALRIDVKYEEDLRRRLPFDWRRELVPELESAATAHLRGTLAGVRAGDVVMVEYSPGRGTTVRVNKMVAASGVHHDLMLAFLDHWLGQRPVTEQIKRTLLGL